MRRVGLEVPRDRGHHEIENPDGGAKSLPSQPEDGEAEGGRERGGENGRHSPVADSLGPALVRNQARHVGRRSREKARPEEAVEEDENDEDLPARREGVGEREAGDRDARDEQHAAPSDPVRESAGERRRERGRVRQEAEEEAGGRRGAAELEDPERRGREELEEREEDREREEAHHEERAGQERLGRHRRSLGGTRRLVREQVTCSPRAGRRATAAACSRGRSASSRERRARSCRP